jgi:hypothetical protein
MEIQRKISTPTWQRVICGLFAVMGAIAIPFVAMAWLVEGRVVQGNVLFALFMAALGTLLFGFVSFTGRLPAFFGTSSPRAK